MMADAKDLVERERTAKEIARTLVSIRKKHRALKSAKMEDEIALGKRLEPIVQPLERLVKSTEQNQNKPSEKVIMEDSDEKIKRKFDSGDGGFVTGEISQPTIKK